MAVLVALITGCLLLQLVFLSGLQQRSAQEARYDEFRADLALGTAPLASVSSGDDGDEALALGSAMAYLEIDAIGLRQVVLEGTTSGVLFEGPGHRRDTPFPGQQGTSVLMGRRATYGGPFSRIGELEEGDLIEVTTGQGEFDYEVMGVRREGDPAPSFVEEGGGRLLLVTADGRPYVPDGVLRVDAEIVGDPVGGRAPLFSPSGLPDAEVFMASDTASLWALALWLQALVVATVGFVWAWFRWGRAKAWIVGAPVLLLVGLVVADQVARLLPNML